MPLFPETDPDHLKWIKEKYSRQSQRINEALYESLGINARTEEDRENYFGSVFNNALDNYESTIYHIRLCMVSPKDFSTAPRKNHVERLASEEAIVLAASEPTPIVYTHTGDPAELPVDTSLYIQDVNLKQHMSYRSNKSGGSDEHYANLLMMNMQIQEPHGLAFDRMFRAAAVKLGYAVGISPAKIVWRVDIWFSGYRGSDYVENIPMRNPLIRSGASEYMPIHSYYMHITQMPVEITLAGSVYTPSLVPVAESYLTKNNLMFVNDDLTIPNLEETTFGNLLDEYAVKLTQARKFKSDQRAPAWIGPRTAGSATFGQSVPRTQEFLAPQYLDEVLTRYHFHAPEELIKEIVPKTTGVQGSDLIYSIDQDIIKTINSWIKLIAKAREGLQTSYPRIIYDVYQHIDYTYAKYNPELNDLVFYDTHIYIVPMVEHRFAPLNEKEYLAVEDVHRDGVLKDYSLRRVYSYLYARDNTEIEQMQVTLKVYYYSNLEQVDYSSYAFRLGALTGGPYQNLLPNKPRVMDQALDDESIDQLKGLMGIVTSGPSERGLSGVRSQITTDETMGDQTVSGGALVNMDDDPKQATDNATAAYGAEFDRTVNYDQISLENFTVRGDPNWLFSYSNTYEIVDMVTKANHLSFVTPTIYIRVYRPSQTEMNGTGTPNEPMELDADLSGFYQIVTVEHTFSGGKFINKLQGYRLAIS